LLQEKNKKMVVTHIECMIDDFKTKFLRICSPRWARDMINPPESSSDHEHAATCVHTYVWQTYKVQVPHHASMYKFSMLNIFQQQHQQLELQERLHENSITYA
jgi:hypothetical protein